MGRATSPHRRRRPPAPALFYGLTGSGLPFNRVVGIDLALPFAVVNVAFFLVCAAELFVKVEEAGDEGIVLRLPPSAEPR
jgi:hypothetical protein